MASALVNNVGLVAPEGFLDHSASAASTCSYGWLSPRISFSCDFPDGDMRDPPAAAFSSEGPAAAPAPAPRGFSPPPSAGKAAMEADLASPSRDIVVDFEFRRVDDPATMLPADELFSGGKLVPRQVTSVQPPPKAAASVLPVASALEALSLEPRRREEASGSDPCAAFSPKAPRCSSRLRELLGLRKAVQSGGAATKLDTRRSSSSSSSAAVAAAAARSKSSTARSLKHFLHRSRRSSSTDSSLSLPLLRDSDSESVSICSRLSLSSSSSSGPDHEDLPRLSLDLHKPSPIFVSLGRNPRAVRLARSLGPSAADPSTGPHQLLDHHPQRHSAPAGVAAAGAAAGGRIGGSSMRRAPEEPVAIPGRGSSVGSPRMNASGKVVFQSLERSSSSPSTFNGGPRVKHRGMERSYSANVVRVTPVLNVPVCSLRRSSKAGSVFGFGQLFSSSPQKKDSVAPGLSSSGAARKGCGAGRSGRTEKATLGNLGNSGPE